MSSLAQRLTDAGLLPEIYRTVEPAYPHEGCGFVFEQDGRLVVLPTRNRAQQLHEMDPESYPRGGADWFEPDMKPWLRSVRSGHTPRVIFHSHPDVGAYFSQGDHDSAVLVDDEGALTERNPGVLHLVVSVRAGTADGARLFRFCSSSASFEFVAAWDAAGALRDGPGPEGPAGESARD